MLRKATPKDALTTARLAVQMWDSHTAEELAQEFTALIKNKNAAVFTLLSETYPLKYPQSQLHTTLFRNTLAPISDPRHLV